MIIIMGIGCRLRRWRGGFSAVAVAVAAVVAVVVVIGAWAHCGRRLLVLVKIGAGGSGSGSGPESESEPEPGRLLLCCSGARLATAQSVTIGVWRMRDGPAWEKLSTLR